MTDEKLNGIPAGASVRGFSKEKDKYNDNAQLNLNKRYKIMKQVN